MKQIIEPYHGKYESVLLFGPPGVGKGTLGKFLASGGGQYHLSSGEIFRRLAGYTPAGKLFYSYAKKGELVPDEETISIWKHYVDGLIATNVYYPHSQYLLLDGIPRTLQQAKLIDQFISVRHVIVLESSNTDSLVERLEWRARCEGKVEEVAPSVIDRRLQAYEREIGALLAFYPVHMVSRVNGEQKPLEVLRDVLVRLSHILSRPLPKG
ncbi:MAG: adenylate kinase family protein [Chlamydiales bacterium]